MQRAASTIAAITTAALVLGNGGCVYYRYDSVGPAATQAAGPTSLTLSRDLATTGIYVPMFGLPAFTSVSELTSEMATPGEPVKAGTRLDVEQAGRLTSRLNLAPCYGSDRRSQAVLLVRVREGSHRGEHLLLRQPPKDWFKDLATTRAWEPTE